MNINNIQTIGILRFYIEAVLVDRKFECYQHWQSYKIILMYTFHHNYSYKTIVGLGSFDIDHVWYCFFYFSLLTKEISIH